MILGHTYRALFDSAGGNACSSFLFVVFQSDIEVGSTLGSVSEGTGKMLHGPECLHSSVSVSFVWVL